MALNKVSQSLPPCDKQNRAARLSAELKQKHGDGFIVNVPEDHVHALRLLSLIDGVGQLGDNSPPNVTLLEDAIILKKDKIANLEYCKEYYTLCFVIMTKHMLQSPHFEADSMLLSALEDGQDSFILVFPDHEVENHLKNLNWQDKLPGTYRLLQPIYLDRDRGKGVPQLKNLFNAHLSKKLERQDKQDKERKEAMEQMRDLTTTAVVSNSFRSLPVNVLIVGDLNSLPPVDILNMRMPPKQGSLSNDSVASFNHMKRGQPLEIRELNRKSEAPPQDIKWSAPYGVMGGFVAAGVLCGVAIAGAYVKYK